MASLRKILPVLMVTAGGLFLIGAIIVAVISNQPIHPAPDLSATPTQVALTDIPRVSLTDAKTAFDQKTAVFVDVRDAQSYASGHIPNALSIPLAEIPASLSELKTSDWIITVCT